MLNEMGWTRRFLLRTGLLMPAGAAFVFLRDRLAHAQEAPLAPTPACGEGETTPSQTAGPFFTPNSPERTSLIEPGITGERLVIEGRVLSTRCQPVAGALVDLWQADADGRYDNTGYRLRGHQFTDREGRYRFETIVPGNYFPRTRHCHVKVQAPARPVLTTQLYFPGEGRNSLDFLFRRDLLMEIAEDSEGQRGRFDFVLDLG
jgi:protocatechuate 3,4-dioxygenase beta subunit